MAQSAAHLPIKPKMRSVVISQAMASPGVVPSYTCLSEKMMTLSKDPADNHRLLS
jgi:hypothetical protein